MPDPADPQTLNRFSYVRGNPVTFGDPTGHYMELGDGLGLRTAPDGSYRVLYGGRVFVNYCEVAVANATLSGDTKYLDRLPTGNLAPGSADYLMNSTTGGLYDLDNENLDPADLILLAHANSYILRNVGKDAFAASSTIPVQVQQDMSFTETRWDTAGRVNQTQQSVLEYSQNKRGHLVRSWSGSDRQPTSGFTWKGAPGSNSGDPEGNWHNRITRESLRWDINHGPPQGPHIDLMSRRIGDYRIFPDGTFQPKIE